VSRPPGPHRYASWGRADAPLQRRLFSIVDMLGHKGLTSWEGYAYFDTDPNSPDFAHHGWISGALSLMHKDLRIAGLAEKRDGCRIYVGLDFIDGRECVAQGRDGLTKDEAQFLQSLDEFMSYWMQVDNDGARIATDRTKAERNQRLFFKELRARWEERPES
jgi:hypothetical protein